MSDQPAAVAAKPTSNVPDTWPGAFGVYKYSKEAVKVNFWGLVVVFVVTMVVRILVGLLIKNVNLNQIVSTLFSTYIALVTYLLYLSGVKGQKLAIGEAMSQSLNPSLYLQLLGLSLVMTVIGVVSFLLLIVPFFIVFPRIVLAPYYLVDKKMSIDEALKASWNDSKGHVGKLWGIFGATVLMILLMVTVIGIPFAIYFLIMYSAAIYVAYFYIAAHPGPTKPVAAAPATPPAAPAAS